MAIPSDKIIDTNVPISAGAEQVEPACQWECIQLLKQVLGYEVRVLMDRQGAIWREYRKHMYPDPNPDVGLAYQFLAHLLDYSAVYYLELAQDEDGNWQAYPDDSELANFDPSDKKWVALAKTYEQETGQIAPIVNATDSDWLHFETILAKHGIQLELLCRDLLKPKP
jgi:hypothetical protein